MLPDFQIEKKGYIAIGPNGNVDFFEKIPYLAKRMDGKPAWFPREYEDCYMVSNDAAVSCFLDESTVYPVKMVIYPDYPKQ